MTTLFSPDPLAPASLARRLQAALAEAARAQVTDHRAPEFGAFLRLPERIAEPGHTGALLLGTAAWLVRAAVLRGWIQADVAELAWRARLAAGYALRALRPSGRLDLLACNPDSEPDTAFALQLACAALSVPEKGERDDQAQAAAVAFEEFVWRAAPGVASGGAHTPNHRWVVASSLAWARHLFPTLPGAETVAAWTAEEADVDADGFYPERSVGVYDAVANRALWLLHDYAEMPGIPEAVGRNLRLNTHLIRADGTADTVFSTRRDAGTRRVPLALVPSYLRAAEALPERAALFRGAAERLAAAPDTAVWEPLSALCWCLHHALTRPPAGAERKAPPEDYTVFVQRPPAVVQSGAARAVAVAGRPAFFSLEYRAARLRAVSVQASWMGVGQIVPETLKTERDTLVLRAEPKPQGRRPGYELPLGRPVPPDGWEASLAERPLRRLDPFAAEIRIEAIGDGYQMRVRVTGGLPGVPVYVNFDFEPGGQWETLGTAFVPLAGQVIFLTRGRGRYVVGGDYLEIAGGSAIHLEPGPRDGSRPSGLVRVMCSLATPVDHGFTLSFGSAGRALAY